MTWSTTLAEIRLQNLKTSKAMSPEVVILFTPLVNMCTVSIHTTSISIHYSNKTKK